MPSLGSTLVVDMPIYNFEKAFVKYFYFILDFGDWPAIYPNDIHSFAYRETG